MIVREVGPEQKEDWDNLVACNPSGHILQSWDWGEFKKTMGNTPHRLGVFDRDALVGVAQYTTHPVPYTDKFIGYLPKGPVVGSPEALGEILEGLKTSAQKNNCVFLKIEPNIPAGLGEWEKVFSTKGLVVSEKEIFAKHTLYLDLTKSEEELLSSMHEKWRYNIRLSERKEVVVSEQNDQHGIETFIRLQKQTAKRNKFFVHTDQYYRNLWLTLQPTGAARILLASVNGKTLAAWMLFKFGNTLYYPYGASADEGREVMPSHALMWGAIKLGKQLGCSKFDLWGAAGPDAPENDPWIGFTRFKQGFNPTLVSFVGAYDLVIEPSWYRVLTFADKVRWFWLRVIRTVL